MKSRNRTHKMHDSRKDKVILPSARVRTAGWALDLAGARLVLVPVLALVVVRVVGSQPGLHGRRLQVVLRLVGIFLEDWVVAGERPFPSRRPPVLAGLLDGRRERLEIEHSEITLHCDYVKTPLRAALSRLQ